MCTRSVCTTTSSLNDDRWPACLRCNGAVWPRGSTRCPSVPRACAAQGVLTDSWPPVPTCLSCCTTWDNLTAIHCVLRVAGLVVVLMLAPHPPLLVLAECVCTCVQVQPKRARAATCGNVSASCVCVCVCVCPWLCEGIVQHSALYLYNREGQLQQLILQPWPTAASTQAGVCIACSCVCVYVLAMFGWAVVVTSASVSLSALGGP